MPRLNSLDDVLFPVEEHPVFVKIKEPFGERQVPVPDKKAIVHGRPGVCLASSVATTDWSPAGPVFDSCLGALQDCRVPRLQFEPFVRTVLRLRRPEPWEPKSPRGQQWQELSSHLQKMCNQYVEELGENAYAVFNVVTADIKAMIQRQQDTYHWHFTFLGANQDAFAEAGGMAVRELRTRYAEVFGEETRAGNKAWLVKWIARTQIMNLLMLAPDWRKQRRMWCELTGV